MQYNWSIRTANFRIDRETVSNSCNVEEFSNLRREYKWLARETMCKYQEKACSRNISAYMVATTGNAWKRDHSAHMCTADSIRLNVKSSRGSGDCLFSASRSLIFLSLPEMTTESPFRSLAKRPRGNDSKWYSKRKRETVSFSSDLKKSKQADNARLMSDRS